MKARIKKTGEIVDIISYNDISTTGSPKYLVSYINSKGVEHGKEGANYHLDFESIDNLTHWQDVRERAAIAAMQGILSNSGLIDYAGLDYRISVIDAANSYANELVEQLKKKEQ